MPDEEATRAQLARIEAMLSHLTAQVGAMYADFERLRPLVDAFAPRPGGPAPTALQQVGMARTMRKAARNGAG